MLSLLQIQVFWQCHRQFFTESENSTLARDALGPKSSHRLHVSADTVIQHTDERFRKIIRDATAEYTAREQPKDNESKLDKIARILSATINDVANDSAIEEFKVFSKYFIMENTMSNDIISEKHTFPFLTYKKRK